MAITYTLRYKDETGRLIRLLMIQCQDDQDAVRTAVLTMQSLYAALEITLGNKLIWRGTRDKANVWASSAAGPGRAWSVQHGAAIKNFEHQSELCGSQ